MNLLKYKLDSLNIQKRKCNIIVGGGGFFSEKVYPNTYTKNWIPEILPWPSTRREVMVGRGMKVRWSENGDEDKTPGKNHRLYSF